MKKSIGSEIKEQNFFQVILELQNHLKCETFIQYFIREINKILGLLSLVLVHKIGKKLTKITFRQNLFKFNTINKFSFHDALAPIRIEKNNKEILALMNSENISLQINLKLKNTIDSKEFDSTVVFFIRFFFTQLLMLSKIENLEMRSVRDDLTVTFNQNYLKAFVSNEIERCKRHGGVFSIVFFDLDNLKSVNDQYGHLIGTEIIKEIAAIIKNNLRKVDILCRFGGDEFVIVLINSDAEKAYIVCDRMRDKIRKHIFLKKYKKNIVISGCFGISCFPRDGKSSNELIQKADLAMFEVKSTGKNGINVFQGE